MISNKWNCGLVVAIVFILLAIAWTSGWLDSGAELDAEVQKLIELRDHTMANRDAMSDAERQKARDAMRRQVDGLSEQQRESFFSSGFSSFASRMEDDYDELMALSLQERNARIDQRIDEMESRRGERGAGGRGDGEGRREGNSDPKKRDERRKRMLDRTTPEQRAKFESMMNMMNDRRAERGLGPIGPGRRS